VGNEITLYISNKLLTRSSVDAEKHCVTRYHPEGGKVSATGWPLYRCIIYGGSKRIGSCTVVQHCHSSAFLSDWKFL